MGVAVGMLVGGLILGYVVGARKDLMKMLNKLAAAEADAADKDKGADGDDNEDVGGDEEAQIEGLIESFMDRDQVTGLDDHPDTEFNPIMMYQVKKVKDEMRARKQIEALLASRDLPPDHLDTLDPKARAELLAEMRSDTSVKVAGNVGSVAGKVRKYGAQQNSTAIMVGVGARFAKGGAGVALDANAVAGIELKKSQEARDRLRVIDMHLAATHDIDVGRESAKKRAGQMGQHGLLKNALETAKETKFKPYGGEAVRRQEEMATYASRGRSRVGAPLDHAITAKNEKDRRASCGLRGASVASKKVANPDDA